MNMTQSAELSLWASLEGLTF